MLTDSGNDALQARRPADVLRPKGRRIGPGEIEVARGESASFPSSIFDQSRMSLTMRSNPLPESQAAFRARIARRPGRSGTAAPAGKRSAYLMAHGGKKGILGTVGFLGFFLFLKQLWVL